MDSGDNRRWILRDLPNNERFQVIGGIQANATFLQILSWNHILRLYRCSGGPAELTSNSAIVRMSYNKNISQPKQRGNPKKIQASTVVNRMTENMFPDLEHSSDI